MENQSAAIKDGKILYTLSTIRDITDVSNKLNKNVSVISLDFLKAFDRVGWDFIFSTLKSSDISDKSSYFADSSDKFIHMIKVTYTNIQSKIKINGFLSDPFNLM